MPTFSSFSPVFRRSRFALAALIAIAASGCTQLQAVRVKDGDGVPHAGAPYNLTYTQFEITVTRRVKSCTVVDGIAQVEIAMGATATRKEVRDPKREYVIDFAQLRSFFKASDVTVEYHDNGALKSVNATVDDKTADLLKGVFTSVGKVLVARAGAAGPGAKACDPDVEKIVASLKDDENALEKKRADLAAATAELEKLIAVAGLLARNSTAAERRELANQVRTVSAAKVELEKQEKAFAGNLQKISVVTKRTWPHDGESFETREPLMAGLTEEQISKWASVDDKEIARLQNTTAVYARLVAASSISRTKPCDQACPEDDVAGLKYRMPGPGRLELCNQKTCNGPEEVFATEAGLISQLGPVLVLPLRNYPFMNQTISASFNDAGQPTKLGFKDQGGAEKLAGSLGSLVDEAIKVREARKPKTQLELVKEETDLLKAQADLAAAKKALTVPTTATQAETLAVLQADTALLQAELAKIQAQAALDAARKQSSQ